MPDIIVTQSIKISESTKVSPRSIVMTQGVTARDVLTIKIEGLQVVQVVGVGEYYQLNLTPIPIEVVDRTAIGETIRSSGVSINVSQSIGVRDVYEGVGVAGEINIVQQVAISTALASPSSGNFYPAASGDDGTRYNGAYNGFSATGNYLTMGGGDNTHWHIFVRFGSVAIPKGSTITAAHITFTAYYAQTSHRNLYIYTNIVDDATAPVSTATYDALALSSAVNWNLAATISAGQTFDTPDLTSIIQDVISRSGWASGQHLQILIKDADSDVASYDCQQPRTYDSGSGYAELHVEWVPPPLRLYSTYYAEAARLGLSLPSPVVRAYDTMIEATEIAIVELFIVTLQSGDVIRWTSHDTNLTYAGNVYTAIPIQRGPINYHTGLEVDDVEVTFGLVGLVVGTNLYTIPQAVRRELFRDAALEIWLVDFNTLSRHRVVWSGNVTSDISYSESFITLRCGSVLDKLKMKIPRYFYTEKCNHPMYSVSSDPIYTLCELNADDWEETGSVESGSNKRRIYAQILGPASLGGASDEDGYFTHGKIEMTSGDADGQVRTIKEHSIEGYINLVKEFDDAIAFGDTFKVWPGCDKTGVCCDERFSNYVHFSGYEYIPNPDEIQND